MGVAGTGWLWVLYALYCAWDVASLVVCTLCAPRACCGSKPSLQTHFATCQDQDQAAGSRTRGIVYV